MKRKLGTILLCGVMFAIFNTVSVFGQEEKVELPDYSKWEKISEKFSAIHNDKPVELAWDVYTYVNSEKTEAARVIVVVHPETKQSWFITYTKASRENPTPKFYLFEPNDKSQWIQVASATDPDEYMKLIKLRYRL